MDESLPSVFVRGTDVWLLPDAPDSGKHLPAHAFEQLMTVLVKDGFDLGVFKSAAGQ
jgi:hypothetical protein